MACEVREGCSMAQGHQCSGFPMKNVGNNGGAEGIMEEKLREADCSVPSTSSLVALVRHEP